MEENNRHGASAPSSYASVTTNGRKKNGDSGSQKDVVEKKPLPSSVSEFVVHINHTCDRCFQNPIVGMRYRAKNVPDFDLCGDCFGEYDEGDDVVFESMQLDCDRRMKNGWALKLQVSQSGADDDTRQVRRVKLCDLWDASNSQLSHSKVVSLAAGFAFPDEVAISTDLKPFDVKTTYTDEDGDEITMSTNKELGDAFLQTLQKHGTPLFVPRKGGLRISAVVANRKRMEDVVDESTTPTPAPRAAAAAYGADFDPKTHAQIHNLYMRLTLAVHAAQQKKHIRGVSKVTPEEQSLLDMFAELTPTSYHPAAPVPPPDCDSQQAATTEEKTTDPDVASNTPTDLDADSNKPSYRRRLSFIHARHTCDGCSSSPIVGARYRSKNISDFDLCSDCFENYKSDDNGDDGANFEAEELGHDRDMQHKWARRQWNNMTATSFAESRFVAALGAVTKTGDTGKDTVQTMIWGDAERQNKIANNEKKKTPAPWKQEEAKRHRSKGCNNRFHGKIRRTQCASGKAEHRMNIRKNGMRGVIEIAAKEAMECQNVNVDNNDKQETPKEETAASAKISPIDVSSTTVLADASVGSDNHDSEKDSTEKNTPVLSADEMKPSGNKIRLYQCINRRDKRRILSTYSMNNIIDAKISPTDVSFANASAATSSGSDNHDSEKDSYEKDTPVSTADEMKTSDDKTRPSKTFMSSDIDDDGANFEAEELGRDHDMQHKWARRQWKEIGAAAFVESRFVAALDAVMQAGETGKDTVQAMMSGDKERQNNNISNEQKKTPNLSKQEEANNEKEIPKEETAAAASAKISPIDVSSTTASADAFVGSDNHDSEKDSTEKETPVSSADEMKPSGENSRPTQCVSRKNKRMILSTYSMNNIIDAKISPTDVSSADASAATSVGSDNHESGKGATDRDTPVSFADKKKLSGENIHPTQFVSRSTKQRNTPRISSTYFMNNIIDAKISPTDVSSATILAATSAGSDNRDSKKDCSEKDSLVSSTNDTNSSGDKICLYRCINMKSEQRNERKDNKQEMIETVVTDAVEPQNNTGEKEISDQKEELAYVQISSTDDATALTATTVFSANEDCDSKKEASNNDSSEKGSHVSAIDAKKPSEYHCDDSFLSDADGNGSIAQEIGRTLDNCVEAMDAITHVMESASMKFDEDFARKLTSTKNSAASGGSNKDADVEIASFPVDAVSIASSIVSDVSDVLKKLEEGNNRPGYTSDATCSADHDTPVQNVSIAKLSASDVSILDEVEASDYDTGTILNALEVDDANKDKAAGGMDNDIQSEDDWSVVDDEEHKATNDEGIARAAAMIGSGLFNSDTSSFFTPDTSTVAN